MNTKEQIKEPIEVIELTAVIVRSDGTVIVPPIIEGMSLTYRELMAMFEADTELREAPPSFVRYVN